MRCACCLRVITGEPFCTSGSVAPIFPSDEAGNVVGEPETPCFCDGSCAWHFWYEAFKRLGVKGKRVRRTLKKIPGLLPPGRKGNHPDDH